MLIDQLLAHVTPEHRPEVERRYAEFSAGAETLGDEHIDSFAKVLSEHALLSRDGLREFLTYRSLVVDPMETQREPGPRYALMSLLARGGMGEVFLGTEPSLKRTVAIKRMHERRADERTLHRRFVTEAQVTAQLEHPAIVPVYGFERDASGALSYAMKFVRGVTLSTFIDETERQIELRGRPDPAHVLKARVETLVPVLNALAYAHRRGVIHRDLKPENIMVGRFGEVLVMDWGIARVLSSPRSSAVRPSGLPRTSEALAERETVSDTVADALSEPPSATSARDTDVQGITRPGAVIGTPDFMSPEQARGEEVDAASDQYALGLILQELVTLRAPIPGRSSEAILEKAKRGERAPIVAKHERISRELRSIIAKATAPLKDQRYLSVEAMAEDVRRYLRDEAVEADPDTGTRRVLRWIGNHRGAAMAIGIGLVLASFVVVATLVWHGRMSADRERAEARAREGAIMHLGAVVDAHCERMTGEFHDYDRLLTRIARSAEVYLSEPAPPSHAVVYRYAQGRRDPADAPPYAVDSEVYGPEKSLRHADFTAAPDLDRQALRAHVDQLARLEPILRATLLASAGDSARSLSLAAAERLVLQRGVPITWVYFAAASGVAVGMPGTWDYDDSPGLDGYDHRREPWYLDAISSREVVWSSGVDENGLGLLLTCTQAAYDDQGELLGVAAIDLTMSHLIDQYLDIRELARVGAESFLLDREGRILVRSSQKEVARTLVDYAPPLLAEPSLRARIRAADVGHASLPLGRLALWNALGDVGLTYLVIGPEAPLLALASERSGRLVR